MGRLEGKVAIVTGAGSAGPGWGNGKATAVCFAREGAAVLAVDRIAEAAEETAGIIASEGGVAHAVVADVGSDADVTAMVEVCIERFSRVDVLHNNVGIMAPGGPEDVRDEDWQRVLDVNVTGTLRCCRAVLPHMVAQGSGSIINVSSIVSIRHLGPDAIVYPTSKAAIEGFTRALAVQYGPSGVRCNAILPGFIRTPMVEQQVFGALGIRDDPEAIARYYERRRSTIPLRRMGSAWDIAAAAVYLASDESGYVTGTELVVDGGVTQVAP